MSETQAAADVTSPRWLRNAALAAGALGVLFALAAPMLSARIEHMPSHSFALFDTDLAATSTFGILLWIYTLLGLAAVILAIAAYLNGGFGRTGRVGLALGVAALAWKYVIYAFIVVVVLLMLLSGISS